MGGPSRQGCESIICLYALSMRWLFAEPFILRIRPFFKWSRRCVSPVSLWGRVYVSAGRGARFWYSVGGSRGSLVHSRTEGI